MTEQIFAIPLASENGLILIASGADMVKLQHISLNQQLNRRLTGKRQGALSMKKQTESESIGDRRERAWLISRELKRLFPHAEIALTYSNHWELLVAVVLSAQCTDKKVNEVTSRLFKKYRTLEDYVTAERAEFEQHVKPTGFYRNKAKNILASAKLIKENCDGRVPKDMQDLLSLPGVGSKTANIIQGNAFGIVEGIAVDTHVRRLSIKLGLSEQKDPHKIERDLMQILPQEEWFDFSYRMIDYGRKICPARKHDCRSHALTKLYPPAAERWP